MVVRQTETNLDPFAIASVGVRVIDGDENDGASPGAVRIVEQGNWTAGRRPEQHICMTFADDGEIGANALRTLVCPFPPVGQDEIQIVTDYRPRDEYFETRFGFTTVVNGGVTGVRYSVTLRDDLANSHSFSVQIAPGQTLQHITHDVDLKANGLTLGSFIEIEIEFINIDATNATIRLFRVTDKEQTSGFAQPEND